MDQAAWWRVADPEPLRLNVRWPALWRPLTWFLSTRLAVLVTVLVADRVDHSPVDGLLRKLTYWDGNYYISIVRDWYPNHVPVGSGGQATKSVLAFFPGYPALARGLSDLTGLSAGPALLVTSALAGCIAAVLLWCLLAGLADEATADRGTLFYLAFPGVFVWSMAYGEALLAMFGLACLLALLCRRWWLAGIFAAFAGATRPSGVVLVACCVVAAAIAIYRRREWRSLAAALIAPLGWLGALGYLGVRTGDALAWFRVEHEGYHEQFDIGKLTAIRIKDTLITPTLKGVPRWNSILPTLCIVIAVVLVWAMWRWRPPLLLWVFSAGFLIFALTSARLGLRPRFLHSAAPLVAAGGVVLRRGWFVAAVAVAMAAQLALIWLTVTARIAIP